MENMMVGESMWPGAEVASSPRNVTGGVLGGVQFAAAGCSGSPPRASGGLSGGRLYDGCMPVAVGWGYFSAPGGGPGGRFGTKIGPQIVQIRSKACQTVQIEPKIDKHERPSGSTSSEMRNFFRRLTK